MEEFLKAFGMIALVIAALAVLVGIFFFINRVVEHFVGKSMMSKAERADFSKTKDSDVDIDDNENDELIAVITAAITAAMSYTADIKTDSDNKPPVKKDNFVRPADSRAPFVIRRVRPL